MRVLYIAPFYDPQPTSGAKIKNLIVTSWLQKHHYVDMVFFVEPSQNITSNEGNLYPVKEERVWRKTSQLKKEIILSQFTGIPYSVQRFFSKKMTQKINELVRLHDYDVLHIDHIFMTQYIPEFFTGKVIYEEHNIDSLYFNRYASITNNLFKKIILNRESIHFKKYENRILPTFDSILAISTIDAAFLKKLGAASSAVVEYPPVVMKNKKQSQKTQLKIGGSPKLLFVGGLDWPPNRDAILWFYQSVWPKIIKHYPQAELTVVGRDKKLLQRTINDDQIHFVGFQPSLAPFYQWADMFIAPIRFGSGVRLKILDAIANSLPVLGTKLAFEGIKIPQNCQIIAENPIDYLNKLELYETMPNEILKKVSQAITSVKKMHTTDRAFSTLKKVYKKLQSRDSGK